MQYSRLVLGTAALGLALWVVVGEQLAGASAHAVINAEVATVRAPIAGTVAMPDPPLGTPVFRDDELATIADPLVDDLRGRDLALELALAEGALARIARSGDAVEAERRRARDRLDAYSAQRIEELGERLAGARARLDAVRRGDTEGILTAALGADAGIPLDPGLPALALEHARERVTTLETALAAAQNGVFLGDGYNDAPFSGQRLAALDLAAATLAAERAEAAARIAALALRLDAARLRVNRTAHAVLAAPANGILWERLAKDGETVGRGQEVLRVLDCDSAIVTASVSEDVFNRLSQGDEARFRLAGDTRVLPATVNRLAGAGAATLYRTLAVAPSERHLERFDVTLLVPALRDEPGLRCRIGRTGRVFFEARPLDGLRGPID